MELSCFLPFLALAAMLWTGAWLLARKALRGRRDRQFQQRLTDLLEGEPAPQVGKRPSPWLWVGTAILALAAFGVSWCTGAVMFYGIR